MTTSRRILFVASACMAVAGAAYAASVYRGAGEIQALSRASPRVDAPLTGEKLPLAGVKKIRVAVCSCTDSTCAPGSYPDPGPNGASHNGFITGGNIDIWYEHADAGWMPTPALNLTLSDGDGGCQNVPDFDSPGGNSRGHMMAITRGVTLGYTDAGNYVKVMLEGINED